MRTFDFLYNAEGKIAEGKEVVYYPTEIGTMNQKS